MRTNVYVYSVRALGTSLGRPVASCVFPPIQPGHVLVKAPAGEIKVRADRVILPRSLESLPTSDGGAAFPPVPTQISFHPPARRSAHRTGANLGSSVCGSTINESKPETLIGALLLFILEITA